jgi:hypothetical protein
MTDDHTGVGISSDEVAQPAHRTVTLAMALRYFAARDKVVAPIVSGHSRPRDRE